MEYVNGIGLCGEINGLRKGACMAFCGYMGFSCNWY